MKRVISVLFLVLGLSLYLDAQINPRALGLRLGGDGAVNGAEISYQQAMGEANRLELDFGFGGGRNHSRVFLAGIYHWHWNINGGLNWYAGPGASLGIYTYDSNRSYFNIAVGGQIGIEYDFNTKGTPILLSIDTRPMWDFLGDYAGFGWGSALSIRYVW